MTPRDWSQRREDVLTRSRRCVPVFVKPARAGSSLGVTEVDDLRPTSSARSRTRRCTTRRCSWRRASRVAEIECARARRPWRRGAARVRPRRDRRRPRGPSFYDFEAKYIDEGRRGRIIPADLRRDRERVQRARRSARSRRSSARGSPASTSSSARTARSSSTRSTPSPASPRRSTRGCARPPACRTPNCSTS